MSNAIIRDTSRSRKGAWIEILSAILETSVDEVAPVRERGLKCINNLLSPMLSRRSRKGAWIEISLLTDISKSSIVAPVRERGLKFCHQNT